MVTPHRTTWLSRSSLILGLIGLGSGLLAIARDLPELMVVMLGASGLAIVLGLASSYFGGTRRGVWVGLVGLFVAMLLPAT